MPKTSPTPGPWQWHWRFEDDIATGSVFSEQWPGMAYAVAMCPRYQTQELWEADAKLIVAARDMLKALQEIAAIQDEYTGTDWCEIERARDIANAAIAKATE